MSTDRGTGEVISVFIPVLNGGALLREVVDAVLAQRAPLPVELLAIDSGSTDGSLDLLAERDVRTVVIPNTEFGHGRTRNLAMELTRGRQVAFLTQDATPAHQGWLAELIRPLVEQQVAAAWGPQLPRPSADPRTRRILLEVYDEVPRTVRDPEESFPVFSDVNSCLRRSDWLKVPFRDVPFAEDFHLSRDLLNAGRALAYVPSAAVSHSNEVSLREHYGRMLDEIGALPRWGAGLSLRWIVRDWLRETRADSRALGQLSWSRRPAGFAWAAIAEAQRSTALYLYNSRPVAFERARAKHSLERQRRARSSETLSSK